MNITVTQSGGVRVLTLSGRFDAAAVGSFKEEASHQAGGGAPRLVVDLAGVSFLDSSGLGALVAVLRRVVQAEGDLRLAGPSSGVRSLFELTRLDRVFDIHPDAGSAVSSFGS